MGPYCKNDEAKQIHLKLTLPKPWTLQQAP